MSNYKENRPTTLTAIIGTNGTGKTTLVKKLILAELKRNSKVLILTPDVAEFNKIEQVNGNFKERINKYKGVRKLIVTRSEAKETLDLINTYFFDGLLIFDDSRAYINSTTLPELETLLTRRRQKMVDIIVVAHGFDKIPPAFFDFLTNIIMFKTVTSVRIRKDKLTNIANWEKIQERINKIAKTNIHYYEIHKI